MGQTVRRAGNKAGLSLERRARHIIKQRRKFCSGTGGLLSALAGKEALVHGPISLEKCDLPHASVTGFCNFTGILSEFNYYVRSTEGIGLANNCNGGAVDTRGFHRVCVRLSGAVSPFGLADFRVGPDGC